MTNIETNANEVKLTGVITKNFEYSHNVHDDDFYTAIISISRISGAIDKIPIIVKSSLIDKELDYTGKIAIIEGEYRSHNNCETGRNMLVLYVYPKTITLTNDLNTPHVNSIKLIGHLCHDANYRVTPLGKNITDIMLAVNRRYNQSDYIPTICWNNNAVSAQKLKTSDHISVCGRIQSRIYDKCLEDNTVEARIAYEVSAYRFDIIK